MRPKPKRDHVGDLADQLNREAVLAWVHHDALNQAPENGQRLAVHRRVGERLVQPLDLAAVEAGEVGMEPRRRRRGLGQHPLEIA